MEAGNEWAEDRSGRTAMPEVDVVDRAVLRERRRRQRAWRMASGVASKDDCRRALVAYSRAVHKERDGAHRRRREQQKMADIEHARVHKPRDCYG